VIHFRPKPTFKTDATVLYLAEKQTPKTAFIPAEVRRAIDKLRQKGQFSGKDKQLFPLLIKGKLILLTGIGKADALTSTGLRITTRQTLLSGYLSKANSLEIVPFSQKETDIRAILEGILIGTYSWNKYKKADPKESEPRRKNITVITPNAKNYKDILTVCS